MRLPILGTASADHTAIIWGMHSGQALLQYTGHAGSVNSLRFHPTKVCHFRKADWPSAGQNLMLFGGGLTERLLKNIFTYTKEMVRKIV